MSQPSVMRLGQPLALADSSSQSCGILNGSMQLPAYLREAVERELEAAPSLNRAANQLTERYKAGKFEATLASAEMRFAYLAVRLPATFAANLHVFTELRNLAPEFAPRTLLDLGSGPGTTGYAVAEVFPSFEAVSFVEKDAALIEVGRRIASSSDRQALKRATWTRADVSSRLDFTPSDLVTISYTIGELGADAAQILLDRAWSLTAEVLVIVEPGTPKAFARMASLRRRLIAAGAHLVAPCPHHGDCPMATVGDWCHFSQRIERTSAHRRLKQGSLGYEDEKFSYLVAAKHPIGQANARIVRHPAKNPGHVQLTLCTAEGIQKQTIGKSQRDRYKAARQSQWGDSWE